MNDMILLLMDRISLISARIPKYKLSTPVIINIYGESRGTGNDRVYLILRRLAQPSI